MSYFFTQHNSDSEVWEYAKGEKGGEFPELREGAIQELRERGVPIEVIEKEISVAITE